MHDQLVSEEVAQEIAKETKKIVRQALDETLVRFNLTEDEFFTAIRNYGQSK